MKVYIMGPKQLAGKSYIPFYKNIVTFTKNYFTNVVCTYPDFWESKMAPKDHYGFLKRQIKSCDLLIAEVSVPATGLGVQLEMAVACKVPVIALVKEGCIPSTLAVGCPAVKSIVGYKGQKDLNLKLKMEFEKL
ncbi:MAG: hypothetical protein ACREBF_02035 [Candidatus Micrarchaeales archaeon]